MKSVLFIIHALITGGAEIITANYAVEMKKRGYDVYILEIWYKGTYLDRYVQENGVKVRKINNQSTALSKALSIIRKKNMSKDIEKVLRSLNPDIIHINTGMNLFDDIEFPKQSKIFYTNHSDVKRSIEMNGERHKNALIRHADEGMRLVSISSNVFRDNKELLPNAENRLIPNGIYFDDVRKEAINKSIFCEELGLPKDVFIVGHVGRYHKVKNHEKLFDVFEIIAKQNPMAYLILIGTGNTEECRRIEDLRAKSNYSDRMILLGNKPNAAKYMAAFDVLILPSYAESFSLVLIEAQIHGVRCVASDVLPREVFCNNNCYSLSIDESNEIWAQVATNKDIHQNSNQLDVFSMDAVIDSLVEYYEE